MGNRIRTHLLTLFCLGIIGLLVGCESSSERAKREAGEWLDEREREERAKIAEVQRQRSIRKAELPTKVNSSVLGTLTEDEVQMLVERPSDYGLKFDHQRNLTRIRLIMRVAAADQGTAIIIEAIRSASAAQAEQLKNTNPDARPIADVVVSSLEQDITALAERYWQKFGDFGWSPISRLEMQAIIRDKCRDELVHLILTARSRSSEPQTPPQKQRERPASPQPQIPRT